MEVSDMWTPSTFEDRLLKKHFDKHGGTAYLEVPIGIATEAGRARRIDAFLIPDGPELKMFKLRASAGEAAGSAW
jgi:hypothetical protein